MSKIRFVRYKHTFICLLAVYDDPKEKKTKNKKINFLPSFLESFLKVDGRVRGKLCLTDLNHLGYAKGLYKATVQLKNCILFNFWLGNFEGFIIRVFILLEKPAKKKKKY